MNDLCCSRVLRRVVLVSIFAPSLIFAQAGGGPSGAGGAASGGAAGGSDSAAAGGGGGGTNAPAPAAVEATPASDDPLQAYFDAKKKLFDTYGTRIGLNWDLTNQAAILGPGSPLDRDVARYDFNIHQMLWQGAEADFDVRGGWGDGPDVDFDNTVNTNQYARTGSHIFVLHLWVQQKLWDDQITLRGGKMDLGDFMDTNRFGYYNFVGYSFAHNFAIPLPGNPLAGMITYEPKSAPWFYISGGVANGAQSSYRAGFEEAVSGQTAMFALGEIGFRTNFFGQKGTYRLEGWYDGRDLPSIDGSDPDDGGRTGVAINLDQNITDQFGVFFRYGYGNQHEFTPMQSWSAGFDWTGVIPTRPKDDLAIGVSQNIFSQQRDGLYDNAASNETYIEAYYNAYIYEWLQVQPIVQAVFNPGGTDSSSELIAGVHVALRF